MALYLMWKYGRTNMNLRVCIFMFTYLLAVSSILSDIEIYIAELVDIR